LHFDVIPRAVDEYHQQLRAYADQDAAKRLANPVFHIHGHNVPASDMVVPFAMLLNLASVAGAEDKDRLWGFIRRYAPEASPERNPQLDAAAEGAVRYFRDFVAPTRRFRLPDAREREALEALRDGLRGWEGEATDEALQGLVYEVGRERFDPMRDWFRALYQVLLGADQGPRFGGFIALYGVAETADLIDRALAGELAGAPVDAAAS
jgi:lysyl-tRNA synthetase class 1